MTLRELSKLYYLNKLIARDKEKLAELRSKLEPGAIMISSMPHNPSPKNVMEETIPLIVELEIQLKKEQSDYIKERIIIEEYIRSVKDYQIRLILSYRFIDLMTWRQISMMIGGGNTEDSVKKMCYRFLKKTDKGELKG